MIDASWHYDDSNAGINLFKTYSPLRFTFPVPAICIGARCVLQSGPSPDLLDICLPGICKRFVHATPPRFPLA